MALLIITLIVMLLSIVNVAHGGINYFHSSYFIAVASGLMWPLAATLVAVQCRSVTDILRFLLMKRTIC